MPVLIEGAPGTGKETFARAIHGAASRSFRPFVALECRAERPAQDFAEGARGGTVCLRHVEALPAVGQAELAAMLAGGWFAAADRAGRAGAAPRLVVSTDGRLVDEVAAGRFREDLFNQLNVMHVWLPPLAERCADIAELADQLRCRFAAELGKPHVAGIAPSTMALLQSAAWHDNLRGLESAIHRAVALADGRELTPGDFPHLLAPANDPAASTVADARQARGERHRRPSSIADSAALRHYAAVRLLRGTGEVRTLKALEEEIIRFSLDHYQGRLSEVARRLGIGRSTLYRRLKEHKIAANGAV